MNRPDTLYREVPALAPTVLFARHEPHPPLDHPVAASATGRPLHEVHPAEPQPATHD